MFDFEISSSKIVSPTGEKLEECLLKREDELKDILTMRGRWDKLSEETKDDLYRKTPINICLTGLFEENKNNNIAIVGTMCSGKSTFWKTFNPEQNKELVRHIAKIGKDEEGYLHAMSSMLKRYYTTHDLSKLDDLSENDSIILIDRDLDDKVDCFIDERPEWKHTATSKAKVKEILIEDRNKIENRLKKAQTNIFNIKWA
ncbi:hypothetical protein LCGC14_1263460 [marine sediment metagenome]|uniref:Uncharacterized protein n=1 Tax=marine sediment metagenome TaxID=412755 RepID=A0A0F9NGV3_9ZZZZ